MIIRKAYKFKLKTNKEVEGKFWLFAGHARYIWNYFWQINNDRLKNNHRIITYLEMDFWSKKLKASDKYGFLSSAPAHAIQQKLKDLDRAYQDGFDKSKPEKRMPTKRKRHTHSSFRYPEPTHFEIANRRIKLPKIGWVRFYKSCVIKGAPKNVTISYKSGSWYASIQVELVVADKAHKSTTAVGLDLGIAKLVTSVTLKDHKIYNPKNSYRHSQDKLACMQRKLKHKIKYSNNWKKQVKKIQKVHSSIANIRGNYLHKISTEISKNHAMIFIEDLKIKNMSKSAKGTLDAPGSKVSAKSGLNKSILDQGWYELKRQLKYKSLWKGGFVETVDPKYTSQKCSCCGYKAKSNRKTQSSFECDDCGFALNADINAARNILAAGLGRVGL